MGALKLTEDLQKATDDLIEYLNAERFSIHLRSMIFEFLQYESNAEAEYLPKLFIELDILYAFLDELVKFQRTNPMPTIEEDEKEV